MTVPPAEGVGWPAHVFDDDEQPDVETVLDHYEAYLLGELERRSGQDLPAQPHTHLTACGA